MKLNEKNSKFCVVRTGFHGGGIVSFHNSLNAALKSKNNNIYPGCDCGCCDIVGITIDDSKEYMVWMSEHYGFCYRVPLLSELSYGDSDFSCLTL